MEKLKFIDLFAGIGGIRLGFEDENTECVFSSEWDKFAQKTYEENFGEKPAGDITKIEAKDIPQHDILMAGFPCQPFSKIGKREGFKNATQGTLFFDVIRILDYHKPKAFLLENVSGILTIDNGKTIQTIMGALDEAGYNASYQVLNAADFGLPQNRRRVYFVGFLKELEVNFKYPVGDPYNRVPISSVLESNMDGYEISEHLQKSYLFKKDDGKPQIVDKNSDIQVNTLVATYHKIQRITGTFVRDGKTGLRLLSENECKALQGFPKDFKIPVSRTQMYRQFGNSVAVPVVKLIADEMKQNLRGAQNYSWSKQLTLHL
ncbi:DNA cytosine methyltransferase (plasmid) [Desemzia incerta]|uniref:DNA cytosine methyltransferase n=1 Tax=Desemzia incerta TaxID=82801 RepID=UPI0024C32608|nr:DNA cytosine methyltransferase [Desemzia incerta]WHZ33224.1 DNA cytosine methyltransferase [Desemzia incerta]